MALGNDPKTPGDRRPRLFTVQLRLALRAVAIIVVLVLLWRRYASQSPAPPAAGSAAAAPSAAAPKRSDARRPARERPDSTPAQPLRLTAARAERDPTLKSGAFEGRVLSWSTGKAVAGASLSFARGDVTSAVSSDSSGGFRFEPDEPGLYTLALVTKEGFFPFSPEWGQSPIAFNARAGERIRDVTIYLSPEIEYVGVVLDAEKRPAAGATVRTLGAARGSRFTTDEKGAFRFAAPDNTVLEARHPSHGVGQAAVDFSVQVSRRLTITLRRGNGADPIGSIAGRVLDPDGAPLHGALVRATENDGDPGGGAGSPPPAGSSEPAAPPPGLRRLFEPWVEASTDDEGRFVLEGLDGASYDLVASHPGFAPERAGGVAPGAAELTLRLTAGARLRGSVRDQASGAPVAAFTVVVARRIGPLHHQQSAQVSAFDAQGHYEVEGLSPGEYAVTVAAHGYAPSPPASIKVPDPPAEVVRDFALTRGGRVSGTVTDEESKAPLEGARVSLEGSIAADTSAVPLLAETTTDAAGHFELEGLAAGLRSITVLAAGHHGRVVSGLVVANDGDVGPIKVELRPTKDGEEPRLELTGIGAVLSAKDDMLVIGQVIDGGGAKEAGIGPGDAILAIDGTTVVEMGFEAAIQRIRGPEGTTVALWVRPANGGELTTIIVVRRRIRA
jgi:Carboxypeptidase regulatory-like domain/PDZ domain